MWHNVSAYVLNGKLVPFPYDFQFNIITTPGYSRHRDVSIENKIKNDMNRYIKRAYSYLSDKDIKIYRNAIIRAQKSYENFDFSDFARARYHLYYKEMISQFDDLFY